MGNGGVLMALAVCIGGEGGDVPHGTGKCWGSHGGCFGVRSGALWQVAGVCSCDGTGVLPNLLMSREQRALKKVKEKQPSIRKR